MKKGMFIVIEGIDGSGTTTQAKLLTSYLFEKHKANVSILTREPTSLNSHGEEIRRRLEGKLLSHEKEIDDFDYWTKLFVNDRRWHLNHVVIPNINHGLHVVSDRHMLSTLAYQSSQGAEMEQLIKMHENFYCPDLTIFLRVPVEIALERIKKNREGTPEYFEKKKGFLEKTAENYEKAIHLVGGQQKIIIIDGSLLLEKVTFLIQKEVSKLGL